MFLVSVPSPVSGAAVSSWVACEGDLQAWPDTSRGLLLCTSNTHWNHGASGRYGEWDNLRWVFQQIDFFLLLIALLLLIFHPFLSHLFLSPSLPPSLPPFTPPPSLHPSVGWKLSRRRNLHVTDYERLVNCFTQSCHWYQTTRLWTWSSWSCDPFFPTEEGSGRYQVILRELETNTTFISALGALPRSPL